MVTIDVCLPPPKKKTRTEIFKSYNLKKNVRAIGQMMSDVRGLGISKVHSAETEPFNTKLTICTSLSRGHSLIYSGCQMGT